MARQLAFALPARPALGRGDFLVAPANALAVAALDRWRDWPGGKLALAGPEGSGKSHLAQAWAAETGARVIEAQALPAIDIAALPADGFVAIENGDRIAGIPPHETALFHLHNHLLSAGGRLLLTGRAAPSRWGIALPDLKSRLEAAQVAELSPPDDALLAAVLVKLFADRQVTVGDTLIRYLLARMERSFAAAHRLVADLDARALEAGRPITRALAQEVLDSNGPEAQ